jgi:DNA-binding transcriptional LysR family regulator
MDRLEAMSILLAVVDAGSISAAARRLALPLTTVSRKISALEDHLNTRLLVRGARRTQLTETGRAYADACRRILDETTEAERLASGEYSAPKGNLSITAPIVFGRLHLLPVVSDFLKAHPAIAIHLILADRIVNLVEEQVDVALRIGALPDSSLITARLGTIRRIVCANPSYLAKRGLPANPSDLAAHDCIAFEGLSPQPQWTFFDGRNQIPVSIRPRLTVNTAEAAIDAAISGLGLTRVLSYQVSGAQHAGNLRVVLVPFEPPAIPVSLVHAPQRPLPLKIRAFIDFAAPRLRALLNAKAA